jgi:hypothetical protein
MTSKIITILAIATMIAVTATAQTVDTSASYVLVNRNSGKVVDVFNFATNDGARIAQWTRGDGNNFRMLSLLHCGDDLLHPDVSGA